MRHAFDNDAFFGAARIIDFQFEHEAVHLRLGQRIGAFLFDRVLRGENQERRRHLISGSGDGRLPLLHTFKQCALDFCRCAVDFIRQNQVCENRSFFNGERVFLRIVNIGSDHIGGKQVRRKLDS